MRLHPAVAEEEILAYLTAAATLRFGETAGESEESLRSLAAAMAVISAVEVPETVEP